MSRTGRTGPSYYEVYPVLHEALSIRYEFGVLHGFIDG